ncbi:MAG TPA: hypothetical protein VFG59_10235 [Anaeromyxobacter sp.]|nr:hypothetical protein [Anaeromyxobacter sp.]
MNRSNRAEETTRKPVNETAEASPKTLRELGVEGGLAAEMEFGLHLLGAVQDGRVMGFTFVTPDGRRHALRAESAPLAPARAA